jgi:hypothetical protein
MGSATGTGSMIGTGGICATTGAATGDADADAPGTTAASCADTDATMARSVPRRSISAGRCIWTVIYIHNEMSVFDRDVAELVGRQKWQNTEEALQRLGPEMQEQIWTTLREEKRRAKLTVATARQLKGDAGWRRQLLRVAAWRVRLARASHCADLDGTVFDGLTMWRLTPLEEQIFDQLYWARRALARRTERVLSVGASQQ